MRQLTGPCRLVLLCLVAGSLCADALIPQDRVTQPFAIRALAESRAVGINSHLTTRYPDAATMPIPAAILADLGVQWVREDLHWHRIQPDPATWDWTFSDAALSALHRQRLQVLAVLGPAVGWATPDPTDHPNQISFAAPDEAAFVAYVAAVVQRYRHVVKHWQVWNEPDQALFWRPAPDPEQYTRLLIATARTIRAIDPTATIVLGGINPFDTSFLRAIAAYGGWHAFDVIAIHPYVDPLNPVEGNLIAAADGVRAIAAQYGWKPVWATEVGWASGASDRDPLALIDAAQQAAYLPQAYYALWQGGVSHVFWYALKDDPHNTYGLFAYGSGRADFSRAKPVAAALRDLAASMPTVDAAMSVTTIHLLDRRVAWQRPAQPNGSIRQAQDGLHIAYRFTTRANDYVAFELREPIALPAHTRALMVRLAGDGSAHHLRLWVRDAEGERFALTVGMIGPEADQVLSAPIGYRALQYGYVSGEGNRRPDAPLALQAIVVDDQYDGWSGVGELIIGEIAALVGEAGDGSYYTLPVSDTRPGTASAMALVGTVGAVAWLPHAIPATR